MEFLSSCKLIANGQEITDFKSVTENARTKNRRVRAMAKTGFAKVKNPELGLSVDYLPPVAGKFDWDALENGTVVLDYEDGQTITYSGVFAIEIGEISTDGDNDVVQTITLGATKRTVS